MLQVNPMRAALTASIAFIVAALAFMVWLIISVSADEGTAREHVVNLLVADGASAADAKFETLTWPRVRPTPSPSTTMALLGGRYSLYAAGTSARDDVVVDVADRGSGVFIGRFTLSGARARATLIVPGASILSFTLKPPPRVVSANTQAYEVVLAIVGPIVER
jgi:hypothetical protein